MMTHYVDSGYLYMNAPANATVFERVLTRSDDVGRIIQESSQGILNICSMGGGPGTELLGIVKHFLQQDDLVPPRKIAFTVIDKVKEWADTWIQLADASEDELRSSLAIDGVEPPTIAPMFVPFDVLDSATYGNLVAQFKKVDLVVFNYLFSENKTRLDQAQQALEELARITREDCVFVVIDRMERNQVFSEEVVNVFQSAFGCEVALSTLGGTLDTDEQTSEMGEMLTATLKRTPRVKFFTDQRRFPTVFWFVVKRR